jgi:hypothetical protein
MLQGDIDSGRTGDKNPMFDRSGGPLGTDDEAAGKPPTPFLIALARYYETVERWTGGDWKPDPGHHKWDGVHVGFIGIIVAVGMVLTLGIWMVRAPSPGAMLENGQAVRRAEMTREGGAASASDVPSCFRHLNLVRQTHWKCLGPFGKGRLLALLRHMQTVCIGTQKPTFVELPVNV